MLRNYLKTAWRNLLHNRLVSFIAIAGFSTGLAFVLLVALFIKNEWSFDRCHVNSQYIYRIAGIATDDRGNVFKANTRAIMGPLFTPAIPAIKNFCRLDGSAALVKKNEEVISENIIRADTTFFTMFSFPLLSGNVGEVLRQPDEAVVTDETALKIYGSIDVVGRIIEVELGGQFYSFKISGVAKKPPYNSSIFFDVVLPFNNAASPKTMEDLQSDWVNTFVFLTVKPDMQATEKALTTAYQSYANSHLQNQLLRYSYVLQPLTDIHLNDAYPTGNGIRKASSKAYSYMLAGIALFILLIGCINFVNLTLARSLKRAKEIGIRKVMGSTRNGLALHFLCESLLFVVVSLLPAVFIITLLTPYFSTFVKSEFHPLVIIDGLVILVGAGIVVATGLLAGAYPAIALSYLKPIQSLTGKIKMSGKSFLGNALIIFQFALAVFLMICVLTMQQQFRFIDRHQLGYNPADICLVQLPRKMQQRALPLLQNQLNRLPFVQQSTIADWSTNLTKFTIDGNATDLYFYQFVDGYFSDFFGIKILEGRTFYAAEMADSNNCMVNHAFVQAMGWQNALGRQIGYKEKTLIVIGVVADYQLSSLKHAIKPMVLMKRTGMQSADLYIHYTRGSFSRTKAAVEEAVKKIDPWHKAEVTTMMDFNAIKYEEDHDLADLMNFSAIVCIILSCLGLFGLSNFTISQRVKEIGIRKVLGAGFFSVISVLTRDFLRFIMVASAIALPTGWWVMHRWLEGFAYRTPLHWWLFCMAGISAVVIAIIAIGYQTVKAALSNPVQSLRAD